jgi:RNA polymerase-binding transcription factor DksA
MRRPAYLSRIAPVEDGSRQVDRVAIEARLDERLAELLRTRAAMKRSSEGMRESELAHIDNHPGDRATEMHDWELDETTGIFLEEEERRIGEARRALANGTYGICADCQKPIPADRLLAMPEAVRCLNCQRHFEGLHRQRTRLA